MEKKCCFTGHRPQKMPWGYNEKNDKCVQYKNNINTISTIKIKKDSCIANKALKMGVLV